MKELGLHKRRHRESKQLRKVKIRKAKKWKRDRKGGKERTTKEVNNFKDINEKSYRQNYKQNFLFRKGVIESEELAPA
jgi:hypothetical protein